MKCIPQSPKYRYNKSMTTPSLTSTLNCTQCGGELHPDEGQTFLTCPYCSATVYVDKSQVVFHFSLNPTLDAKGAQGALARWMSGNQTVKDLDKKARVTGYTFQYFPLWYFKHKDGAKETVDLLPGAATSVTELRSMKLPAGDLQKYDSSLDSQAVQPTVPLEAARAWLKESHPNVETRETSLVHVPIYVFKYTFNNQTYTAVVEAATGSVLANIFPSKPEAPYLLAGGITAAVYLCLALSPILGFGSGGDIGGVGIMGVAIVIGIIAAPFLFLFALFVASKI
jgi:predicted RNA-binding Zn-ribbon protein involved in translation (DUF1610 family)